MYLSRVEINPYRRETMRALASPQVLHAVVESSFPSLPDPDGKRNLWRVDKLGNSLYILVQSRIKPDFTHLVEQFGWPASEQTWETKDYDPFLSRLQMSQQWRFRLRANPVHSIKKEASGPDRGQVLSHITVDQQKKWLSDRSRQHGFKIEEGIGGSDSADAEMRQGGFDIVQREMKKFQRGGRPVTLSMVTFEGVLTVENSEVFVNTLIHGIGRAKAYGCGLLTLARL
jgi:CRISPR system Cascade subunit CasE